MSGPAQTAQQPQINLAAQQIAMKGLQAHDDHALQHGSHSGGHASGAAVGGSSMVGGQGMGTPIGGQGVGSSLKQQFNLGTESLDSVYHLEGVLNGKIEDFFNQNQAPFGIGHQGFDAQHLGMGNTQLEKVGFAEQTNAGIQTLRGSTRNNEQQH